jgi:hypothetical protein
MAEDKAHPGWGAEMGASDHIATYEGFITGANWGIAFLVVLLGGMAYFLL